MAASLTEEELARLEALEARVTPTPWRAGNVELDGIFVAATHADRMGPERVLLRMNQHFNGYDLDAQFIAAMRNALPALLASARAVQRVEAVLAELADDEGLTRREAAILAALTAAAEPTDGEPTRLPICPGCWVPQGTPCRQKCHSNSDGECDWEGCPQNRDNEPHKSGRSCPLYDWEDRTT